MKVTGVFSCLLRVSLIQPFTFGLFERVVICCFGLFEKVVISLIWLFEKVVICCFKDVTQKCTFSCLGTEKHDFKILPSALWACFRIVNVILAQKAFN